MEFSHLVRPRSVEEAYSYVVERNALLLGGGAWLRMSPRSVETAVDLSSLDLRYIRQSGQLIEIGAMATARDVETSAVLEHAFGDVFRHAAENIVGVQMRNIVSMGGTIAGRFGFSDLNTLFLALDAHLVLHSAGELGIESFLAKAPKFPLLIEKVLIDSGIRSAFKSVRNTATDLPILNAAVALTPKGWRIAVGARPGPARSAPNAAHLLGSAETPSDEHIVAAARATAEELSFRSDIRGTAEYRRSVCAVLVRRALTEATS
ncbi:MAG TPA: FAD binding domain-containing protein [Spirochaetia bacterium]|nr:FAD binding domain-containing protein [Spirochaetia bacterium]